MPSFCAMIWSVLGFLRSYAFAYNHYEFILQLPLCVSAPWSTIFLPANVIPVCSSTKPPLKDCHQSGISGPRLQASLCDLVFSVCNSKLHSSLRLQTKAALTHTTSNSRPPSNPAQHSPHQTPG